jgi:DnaJ family protein C protein 9
MTVSEDLKTIDPYEILGVNKDSELKEIKKAYHKLCLKYHPDKNEGFRVEFDRVQLSYLVLSDEKKRKRYDRTGVVSLDDKQFEDEDFDWNDYFRGQFQEISKEMIEKDKEEYQGSEEELADIKNEFVLLKGNMEKLFEVIIHLEFNIESEKRIFKICEKLLEDKEVKEDEVPQWKNYVNKRDDIVKKMERRRKREAAAVERAIKKGKTQKKENDDLGDLKALIAGNAKRHREQMEGIAEKYSKRRQK